MIKVGQIYKLKDTTKFHGDQTVEVIKVAPGIVYAVSEEYGILDRFCSHFGFSSIFRENLVYELSLRKFRAGIVKGNIILDVVATADNIKELVAMGLTLQDDEETKDL